MPSDNIDQRLDRLAERHEVLAQSLELLTRDVHELRETVQLISGTATTLVTAVQQDAENIRALARIAEIHERPLTDLEGE